VRSTQIVGFNTI
jgi:seryl-tRNA synthetase